MAKVEEAAPVAPEKVSDITDVPLTALRLWDRNPRRIDKDRYEALKNSMRKDPEMLRARPLMALPDGRVIAGNMRLRAADDLGWERIKVVYVDLDEDEAITWALRDNNPYGEWDEQGLTELLYELTQRDVDLEMTGFAAADLTRLLAEFDGINPQDGVEPDPRGESLALSDVSIGDPTHKVERGEVWNVGHHKLVVAGVYDGWEQWAPLLEPGTLFVPYPTPTLPLTERAEQARLVMVQPDRWLAGHVLDKYAAVHGDESVTRG